MCKHSIKSVSPKQRCPRHMWRCCLPHFVPEQLPTHCAQWPTWSDRPRYVIVGPNKPQAPSLAHKAVCHCWCPQFVISRDTFLSFGRRKTKSKTVKRTERIHVIGAAPRCWCGGGAALLGLCSECQHGDPAKFWGAEFGMRVHCEDLLEWGRCCGRLSPRLTAP